jgi:hypothetical protein
LVEAQLAVNHCRIYTLWTDGNYPKLTAISLRGIADFASGYPANIQDILNVGVQRLR